ncbi:MAG: FecCD family ABC transporter permease [Leucobacter sp.]
MTLTAAERGRAAAPLSAASEPKPRRRGWVLGAGLLVVCGVLVATVIASLAVGSRAIDPQTVIAALFSYDEENPLHLMVRELRVPRTVYGILIGAALAVCGGLIQAFTRNPLADPGILGVNAGASFAVTFAVGVLGLTAPGAYVPFALGGAFALTVLVYALGSFGPSGATPMKLTLAGVALGAAFTGFTTAIVLQNNSTLQVMRFWGVGSVAGRDLANLAWAAPLIGLGLLLGMLSARSLNALALGDDLAQALGARIRFTRVTVIIAVTLLAGTAVAAAGPIGFVGIMIPHAVRWFTGPDQRWVLAYSLIVGAAFLLLADILGRIALPNGELRVGIVTGLLGAPVLIALVRRRQVSGL